MAERRDRYDCAECKKAFVVAYEQAAATEPQELTPVACPHCDGVNYVSAARRAVYTLKYRAVAEVRDRQECWGCRRPFVVVYACEPHELGEMAAVTCPFCGWVNYASVARSALGGLDRGYHTERVGVKGGEA